MELKDLLKALNINSRRAYELLNVLSAVPNERPMLQRVKYPQHSELVFLDGEPLHLPNIALLPNSLERELHELHQLLGYVATVPQRERSGAPEMKKARNDPQPEHPTTLEELAKAKEE
ncbi:uncharacterized protein ACA1_182240 [Acanthamoeba castellanii str. Neff]|uniref:Uncharacterized protein n=1 Tax=Acanthamoeba castellanii (strain ATCC 30010 / Neff) TaxID=1257118 RepID=L8H7V0_ACACF|nr:uncharacterized protein ACA1_182240 [Acanthamoeba castellanii str. Neff]ELR21322.1 hypothetical protein ACA1_182240 [Acanthamoeba castellanii str. Neff]